MASQNNNVKYINVNDSLVANQKNNVRYVAINENTVTNQKNNVRYVAEDSIRHGIKGISISGGCSNNYIIAQDSNVNLFINQ